MNISTDPTTGQNHNGQTNLVKAQNQLGTKSTLRMKQNWYIHLCYTRKVIHLHLFALYYHP